LFFTNLAESQEVSEWSDRLRQFTMDDER
jgi:hypothetical protein